MSRPPAPLAAALIGREAELSALADIVGNASQWGAAVLVRGEAGIGKSALRIFPKLGISNRNQLRDVLPMQAPT